MAPSQPATAAAAEPHAAASAEQQQAQRRRRPRCGAAVPARRSALQAALDKALDAAAAAAAAARSALLWPSPVLVDFCTFKPPEELRVLLSDVDISWKAALQEQHDLFSPGGRQWSGSIDSQDGQDKEHGEGATSVDAHAAEVQAIYDFQMRVFRKAGLSPTGTFLPKSIHPKYVGPEGPVTDTPASMAECQLSLCSAVESLMAKLQLQPHDIDIVVTACSIFCPTPSMSSMLVNRFGFKKSVMAFSLGGMGCANGVLAVDLVMSLLKVHPDCNALFVATEVVTPALYRGADRHRLVTNVLFRLGATATLFSNQYRWRAGGQAKYRVLKSIRVHTGARDAAYEAIHYSPDDVGINGIYLGRNVVTEATRALTSAMESIAPYVLTWRQLGQAALFYGSRHLRRLRSNASGRRAAAAMAGAPRAVAGGNGSGSAEGAVATPRADTKSNGTTPGPPGGAAEPINGSCETAALLSTVGSGNGNGNGSGSGSGSDSGNGNGSTDNSGKGTGTNGKGCNRQTIENSHSGGPSGGPSGGTSGTSSGGDGGGRFQPCFSEGVQHFLLHAGGAKILDGLGVALKLDEHHLEPSRAVLRDYGNVSSSTTWYTLSYIETVRGLKRGDRVLQVGVGSGIKCGINLLQALRSIDDEHEAWSHAVDDGRRHALAAMRERQRLRRMAVSAPVVLATALLVLLVAVLLQSAVMRFY